MHISQIVLFPENFTDTSVYPFSMALLRNTTNIGFTSNVTFFAGENGCGKSTLLKAIAKKCGIHIWSEDFRARAHFNPHEEELSRFIDITWTKGLKPGAFFSAETYEHMVRMIDEWASTDPGLFNYFGGKSLLEQSHGESFMAFFTSRFVREGIYFLDEPETALSPRKQLEFMRFLSAMSGDDHAQFIIATHSPILLGCPGATILSFGNAGIRAARYEETEHFTVYRDFIMGRVDASLEDCR